MDLHLLARAAKGAGALTRDRALVLLSAVAPEGWELSRLLTLTWREAYLLVRRGSGTPLGEALRALLRRMRDDGGAQPEAPVFGSRKGRGARPVGRIQAWRVIHRALASVGLVGAYTALRAVTVALRLAPDDELDLEALVPATGCTSRFTNHRGRGPPGE